MRGTRLPSSTHAHLPRLDAVAVLREARDAAQVGAWEVELALGAALRHRAGGDRRRREPRLVVGTPRTHDAVRVVMISPVSTRPT